jgi:hypothetical protein
MPTQYYRKNQSPETRARKKSSELTKVRRKYKRNLTLSRKLLPGEKEHVADMVIVLRLAGYNQDQMASVVNLGLSQVKALLAEPYVAEKLLAMRKALPQAALELLQDYMVEAVQTLVDIMRMGDDEKIVLAAAGEILDRGGLSKASRQERHEVREKRTTFTDDGIVEKLRQAPWSAGACGTGDREPGEAPLRQQSEQLASSIPEEPQVSRFLETSEHPSCRARNSSARLSRLRSG